MANTKNHAKILNRNGFSLNLFIKGGKTMRINVTLACTECGDRNYITTKNKRTNPERIEMMKYCPRLNKHTLHRETK